MSETFFIDDIAQEIKKEFLKFEDEIIEFEENGVSKVTEITYKVFTDGTKEKACSLTHTKPFGNPIEPEPTEEELMKAEILLNQASILAKQNEHDEVLAEILLNQMEV